MLSLIATVFSGKLAKGLVAVWFKQKTILEMSGDFIGELIEGKVDNIIAKRRAERIISSIEDDLVEKISRFIEIEYGKRKKG